MKHTKTWGHYRWIMGDKAFIVSSIENKQFSLLMCSSGNIIAWLTDKEFEFIKLYKQQTIDFFYKFHEESGTYYSHGDY
jgi:hypothetical protein